MNIIVSKISLSLLNSLSGLSWKNAFRLSSVLKWLLFDVVGYRKEVIRINLKNSFPEKSDSELKIIADNFYLHFTDLIVETIKFRTASPEVVRDRLQGDITVMDDFYSKKTNIIYLMGHRGNWELANLFSSLCLPTNALSCTAHCKIKNLTPGSSISVPGSVPNWFQWIKFSKNYKSRETSRML